MGYLAYGFAAGASKEWLKQSDERRANQYQEIRDKRLSDLRKGEAEFEQGLRTEENIRAEGVSAEQAKLDREQRSEQARLDRESREKIGMHEGQYTLGRGDIRYDAAGNEIARGPEYEHAPTAASQAHNQWLAESVERRGAGGTAVGRSKRTDLYNEWQKMAYVTTTDDLGNKIISRDPSIPDWVTWHNSQVTDAYRLSPADPNFQSRDPGELFMLAQQQPEFNAPGGRDMAIQSIQARFPWWQPPGGKDEKKDAKKDVSEEAAEAASRSLDETGAGTTPQPADEFSGTMPQPLNAGASTSATPDQGMLSQGAGDLRQRAQTRASNIQSEKAALDAEEERLFKAARTGNQQAIREYAAWKKKHGR